MELDKDILCKELTVSPKIYSPKTCKFVTPKQNREARADKMDSFTGLAKIQQLRKELENEK